MRPRTPSHLFTRWTPALSSRTEKNQSLCWVDVIFTDEGNQYNKCHSAFWSSRCCRRNDESPTSESNRAALSLELTVTQSWTLNWTLGFHADTDCTSHGWEKRRRKNSLSWLQRGVTSSCNNTLHWCEQGAPHTPSRIHLTEERLLLWNCAPAFISPHGLGR